MRDSVFSDLKDIQGEIMKRSVSFLLMLVMVLALAFALSSCGECEHLNTEVKQEVTAEGNCMQPSTIDEIVYCVDCEAEISRTSKKGAVGDHIASTQPVKENRDVLDCTVGGTYDSVTYCSVARCGLELSRDTGVTEAPKAKHTTATKVVYNESHSNAQILEYCTQCAFQKLRAPQAGEIKPSQSTTSGSAHSHNNTTAGACKYCNHVLGTSNAIFNYVENADAPGTYTLTGVKTGASIPQAVFIGYIKNSAGTLCPVTGIAPEAFKNVVGIRAITFGDCVKTVGTDAFAGCKIETVFTYNLAKWAEIDFANEKANPLNGANTFSPNKIAVNSGTVFSTKGIEKIGTYAFAGLKANSVYIAPETKTIGEGAFASCQTLLHVYFDKDGVTTGRTVGKGAFADCGNIRKVYTPSEAIWLRNTFADATANPISFADAIYFGNNKFSGTINLSGVTAISDYAFANLGITSVTIPASVTTIGIGAFAGCAGLSTVTFASGSTLSTIGAAAFAGTAVTSVVIPSGVSTVADGAFEGCAALASVTIPASVTTIGKNAFKGCSALTSVTLPENLTVISDGVFENCTSLNNVVFSANLTSIGASAFANCVSLTKLNLTSMVAAIGANAFKGCTAITEINFNTALSTIGEGAFSGCVGVKTIVVPTGVTSIGLGAFAGCTSLESISVPFVGKAVGAAENNFGYIFGATETAGKDADDNDIVIPADNRAFVPYSLNTVIINGNITTISKDAFKGCEGIVEIVLPDSIVSIGANAFDGCTSLDSVFYPDLDKWCSIDFANYLANPLSNANYLYIDGALVEELVIDVNVKPYAFYGATGITSIVIAEGVTSIGNDAFYGCSAVESVSLPTTLASVGARAFYGCDNIAAVAITDLAKWCAVSFADVFANPLYYADSLTVGGVEVTELVIPAGVTKISAYAFTYCDFLTAVDFADVTEIGTAAFRGCVGLTAVTLTNVTAIGDSAFEACSSLKTVVLTAAQTIGARAFANCAIEGALDISAATVIGNQAFLNCIKITKVTLGAAQSIGASAFYNCKALTEINIPATVTVIGASAFAECSLTKVTFANVNGWVVNNAAIDASRLTDSESKLDTAKCAAELTALSAYEWARS